LKILSSLNFDTTAPEKIKIKLIQLGYKSLKILEFFDLLEFPLKVYEIHTIWIQKFEIFDLCISIEIV